MTYQRSFNRFELKYLMPVDEAWSFLGEISGLVTADPHSGDRGYAIRSMYYDSPDLTFFWEKLDGIRVRRKLRLRHYPDSAKDQLFLEIKGRIGETVQKRRIALPRAEALALMSGGGRSETGEVDSPVVAEALFLNHHYQLAPKTLVAYDRHAWFGNYDQGLRITIDANLKCSTETFGVEDRELSGSYFLPPDMAVLEIKFNHAIPPWLVQHVARYQCTFRRISKYCYGINHLYFRDKML